MSEISYPQWRDANASIAYPFGDDLSRKSLDGRMTIPNEWLVDAAVYSPLASGIAYISKIVLTESEVTVTLADDSDQELGSGSGDRFSTNPLVIKDADEQPVATLVVGEAGSSPLFAFHPGTYRFLAEATELVASCVFWPASGSFQGFEVGGQRLIGTEILLVGERGIQLTAEETVEIQPSGQATQVELIRIHAVGDPQYLTRQCSDASQRPKRFVREIVFQYGDYTHICKPDKTGNILLLAGSPSTTQSALKLITSADKLSLGLMGTSIR